MEQHRFEGKGKPEPAHAFIHCVPTPFKTCYPPDLSKVEGLSRSMLPVLKDVDLVMVESTIHVVTTEQVAALIRMARPEPTQDVLQVAHYPERVFSDNAIHEIIDNEGVVVGHGADSPWSYHSFSQGTVDVATSKRRGLWWPSRCAGLCPNNPGGENLRSRSDYRGQLLRLNTSSTDLATASR